MLPTLFYIPEQIAGVPLFGVGLLLFAWIALSGVLLFRAVRIQGWNSDTGFQFLMSALFCVAIVKLLPSVGVPGKGLPIRGYGVMLIVATASAIYVAIQRGQKMGLEPDSIFELAFWIFPAGIVGGRLFYVIEYWDEVYSKSRSSQWWFDVLNFTSGGLVIYGALFGGAAAFIAFCLVKKLNPLALADLVAPSLAIGQSLGRVGCFLSGCCFGGLCDAPWGVTFPLESAVGQRQIEQGLLPVFGLHLEANAQTKAIIVAKVEGKSSAAAQEIPVGSRLVSVNSEPATDRERVLMLLGAAQASQQPIEVVFEGIGVKSLVSNTPMRSLPVHPAQLYSAIDAILLAAVLWTYYPYRRRDGECLLLLLTLHPISRFLLEIIRVDESGFLGSNLSISQHISIGLLGIAVVGWALLLTLRKPAITFPLQSPSTN